ncbi:MAG TPA: transcription elongation factor GreA [candidate division Zixibacteria bacterium]|jgi:transcription elongation factor GreA
MAIADYIYLTPDGKRKLQDELKHLKTVERPRIIGEISRARDLGDLSENAEYHAAKERQVFIERKISDLEDKLMRVRLIDGSAVDGDRARLLSFVTVRDPNSGEKIRYQLVSEEEADFEEDRIAIQSPVGKGLLGKAVGETVRIKVPAGEITYEILAIDRP